MQPLFLVSFIHSSANQPTFNSSLAVYILRFGRICFWIYRCWAHYRRSRLWLSSVAWHYMCTNHCIGGNLLFGKKIERRLRKRQSADSKKYGERTQRLAKLYWDVFFNNKIHAFWCINLLIINYTSTLHIYWAAFVCLQVYTRYRSLMMEWKSASFSWHKLWFVWFEQEIITCMDICVLNT